MKQKQKLLAVLILFPILFFTILVMMTLHVSRSGGSSQVTDIRTTAGKGALDSSRRGDTEQADVMRAEEVVQGFFDAGGRVVVVVMHPTSRFLDIQLPYLLRMQRPYGNSPLDKTRIVSEALIYVSDGDDTKGRELWQLCEAYEGFLSIVYNKNRHHKSACQLFGEMNDPRTLYVRLSAATAYIHEDAVFEMVSQKLLRPQYLLVSANVVNNREISTVHEARGVFEAGTILNEIRFEEANALEALGLERSLAKRELPSPPFRFTRGQDISAPHAYLQHLLFLKALRAPASSHGKLLDKYRFDVMDFSALQFDAWTPDVYAFSGADVLSDFSMEECRAMPTFAIDHPDESFSGMSQLDYYLTSTQKGMGKKNKRYAVAVGRALAVVFVTHTQMLTFQREPPYKAIHIAPRGLEGYEMDSVTFMDPYFDAAMRVLGDQIQVEEDDNAIQELQKARDASAADDAPLQLNGGEETTKLLQSLTARDIPEYVGGDPEAIVSIQEKQDPNYDLDRLYKAREYISSGGRYGIECEPGSEGTGSLSGRFSQFGCYGWLEDRMLFRYQTLSDKLFGEIDGTFKRIPQQS